MLVDLTINSLAQALFSAAEDEPVDEDNFETYCDTIAEEMYNDLTTKASEQQPDPLAELEKWCLSMGTMYKIEIDSDYSPNKFRISVYWPSYQFTVSGNNLKDTIRAALAKAREQEKS